MHPNGQFAWTDKTELLQFIQEKSFSTIFFCGAEGPQVVHVPVTVGEEHRLRFHVARSNRATPYLDGADVLLSCLGPDAYVSPDWYRTVNQVPTWNYVAVECRGVARLLDDRELVDQLDCLSAEHEARLAPKAPWTRYKMKPGLFKSMTKAIACFEIEISDLRGTRKLGQNKRAEERNGALAGLDEVGAAELAAAMREEFARA